MKKTIYLECKMGAAGDMLMAALLEFVDIDKFVNNMNSLELPNVRVATEDVIKSGIKGKTVRVFIGDKEEGDSSVDDEISGYHSVTSHRTLDDICVLIKGLDLSEKVKSNAITIYNQLAEAESQVHGTKVEDIHFHELGTIDAIVDIVGVCILMEMISPDRVVASPINVGGGMVRCHHGMLPVPAPATAYLLNNIPMYTDDTIEGELCTPTGAVLLKYFVDEFGSMPTIKTQSIGYGFGKKEFDRLNCIRAFLGKEATSLSTHESKDRVIELQCNIDDMTPEDIGYAINKLFDEGALEVYSTSVYMKKNRPGILLSVICEEPAKEEMVRAIFKHTSTIGIREKKHERYVLDRSERICNTKYGDVRLKEVSGYGVRRDKLEYEDIARLANENDISIGDIRNGKISNK